MISVQEDLIFFYNEMTKYSSEIPIGVKYDIKNKVVQFRQHSKTSNFSLLNNYCLNLRNLTDTTALLPEDFNKMMIDLRKLVDSGKLLNERILISPNKYGFSVMETNRDAQEFGPLEITTIKLVSSNWWLFRKVVQLKYKLIII